jgi:hypothetical protein
MPPKKGGAKALGGLTLARGIGPPDIKLLNKLTSDSVGVGIFSSIRLTSSQFVELGRFSFSSWEDLTRKTGVTPETLKLIQELEAFRRHLVSTEAQADGWVEKPPTSTAAAAAGRLRGAAINRDRVG